MTIKSVCFEYIVLKMAEQYVQKNYEITTKSLVEVFSFFNSNNDFTTEKISLFPYLVCVANGKKIELLKLFDGFHPSDLGITEKEIDSLIQENNFSLFKITNNIVEINVIDFDEEFTSLNSKNFLSTIKKITEFNFDSSENDYLSWIDCSIQQLDKKLTDFAILPIKDISFWSRRNIAWQKYYFIYTNFQGTGQNKDLIQVVEAAFKNILQEEPSVFEPKRHRVLQ